MEHDGSTADWVEQVYAIPMRMRHEHSSIIELFTPAASHLDDRPGFVAAITAWIRSHRDLVDAWIVYSGDQRGTPAAYFDPTPDGFVVGFYDGGMRDEVRYTQDQDVEACVDFIYRTASNVLRQRPGR